MAKKITVTPKLVKDLIVPRIATSRKGDNGIVLVVGGSRIYHGAPILASMAALRSGTDLVFTAVPKSSIIAVRAYSPDIIALPLPDDKLTSGLVNRLMAMLPKKPHAAAIGMGMSIAKPEALVSLIRQLRNAEIKLLLDASALIPEILREIAGTGTIVTPHAGEYNRLFEKHPGTNEDVQTSTVQTAAKEYGITVVLKGSINIISDGVSEHTAVIKRSTPAMTVGGMGDILSGLTVGLLTKYSSFNASILGVFLNGVAASLAYERVGLHMVATDVIEDLPNAMKPFDLIKDQDE
ncbi:MAG: NAD(P)H-hydrate dehydratase [Candidatus Nitrosopolaris wilkensis]|nr:MAG: NAD(P)H-hydrate dehydratase [Candidatus Nitrosopolaris wilkensis]